MPTIVNNPPAAESDTGGLGTIIGAILLVALVFLLIFYGLPLLRGSSSPAPAGTGTQQQGPSSESKSGIQVDTPDKVDVQIQQPGQPGQ